MRAVRSAQVQRSGATGRRSGRKALTNAPVWAILTPIGWLLGECRLRMEVARQIDWDSYRHLCSLVESQ